MAGELEFSRVLLRPLSSTDLEVLAAWDQDEEVNRFLGKRFSRSGADAWLEDYRRGRGVAMAIVADRDHIIGDVELRHINWRRGEAELRICLGNKSYWNLGLGTEAVRLIVSYALAQLGLKSVYLKVYASNARAIRCYRKCGFRSVGILKKGTREDDDIILMVADGQGRRMEA